RLCQDHRMKHFLLVCFLPMTLAAQNMQQLTEKLGKTVLYGDVALSPDATRIAWVQSTAATTSRLTHIREISGNAPAKLVDIPITGDRTDFDPAWSPDSKMLTFFSSAGEKNWWVAQIYTIDTAKVNATSIYKPWFQIAVPRWSPDGKSIAFIQGLMSDEGFHGGDLFTMTVDGRDVVNRTSSRKTSINSFFWQTPDRIVLVEYVGSGSAISELSLRDNSAQTIWKGPEGMHAFGNFPDFDLSK